MPCVGIPLILSINFPHEEWYKFRPWKELLGFPIQQVFDVVAGDRTRI